MRESLIKSCAERVIDHTASNGGRCRLGFVKELVDELNQRAPLLEITRNDINNKVRIIKGPKAQPQPTATPAPGRGWVDAPLMSSSLSSLPMPPPPPALPIPCRYPPAREDRSLYPSTRSSTHKARRHQVPAVHDL